MATLKDIINLPHEALRGRSKRVGVIGGQIKQIIQDMQQATLDWEDSRKHEIGVALAAIQINKPLRIVIIRNNFDNKEDRTFLVFINPEIVKYEGQQVEDYEGCLSIKDIYGRVPRYERIKLRALDINGKQIRIKAEGFLARVFQHEIDHTNGIVFIDHIKDQPDAFFQLDETGKLNPLDYKKKIKNNKDLWN